MNATDLARIWTRLADSTFRFSANITYCRVIETLIALLDLWWNIMAVILLFVITIIVTHFSESLRGLWLSPTPLELKHQWPHGLTECGHWSITGSGERKGFRPWKCPVKIYYSNLTLWLEELTQGIFPAYGNKDEYKETSKWASRQAIVFTREERD